MPQRIWPSLIRPGHLDAKEVVQNEALEKRLVMVIRPLTELIMARPNSAPSTRSPRLCCGPRPTSQLLDQPVFLCPKLPFGPALYLQRFGVDDFDSHFLGISFDLHLGLFAPISASVLRPGRIDFRKDKGLLSGTKLA